ncbi:MAG: HDOD domain-containing protein [Rubripirellula sp.]
MSNATANSANRLSRRVEQARWEFTLPDGARRLIAAGDFEGRANETLVRWLDSSPAAADRLVRWCNTPLFNMGRPFESLFEAARIMDPLELARLAVVAFVRELFLPDLHIDLYRREMLWSHSSAVGAVASMISRCSGRGDPGVAFVAGAMHDIGICASEHLDPVGFERVLSQVDELSPLHEVEREMRGWDHAELGAEILHQWGMPEEISMVARHHHQAEQQMDGPHADLIGCVAVANYLCSRSGWSSLDCHNVAPPSNVVFSHLGIDANLLTVLGQQLYSSLNHAGSLR